MFREMRRFKQQVTDEECRRILSEEPRGAFSVIGDDGYPYTIPVDFFYDEGDNKIYIHSAKVGHKIDAISTCEKVCFTTWNQGYKEEGHWEWNSTSVVIFGRASIVEDRELMLSRLRKLGEKYFPTQEYLDEEMASNSVTRVSLIAITIDHMTGKLVNEK